MRDTHTGRSVSSVAAELGVSPSTLRSWERRYGIGPATHRAGDRRLYSQRDINQLKLMVDLIQQGLGAKQAAEQSKVSVASGPSDGRLNAEALSVIAQNNPERLEEVLRHAAMTQGVADLWTQVVQPAVRSMVRDPAGRIPGDVAEVDVYAALALVERDILRTSPAPDPDWRVSVVVGELHMAVGGVIVTALAAKGIATRVLVVPAIEGLNPVEHVRAHLKIFVPNVVVYVHELPPPSEESLKLIDEYEAAFILVAEVLPDYLHPRLQKVRSVVGCVEEVIALKAQAG